MKIWLESVDLPLIEKGVRLGLLHGVVVHHIIDTFKFC